VASLFRWGLKAGGGGRMERIGISEEQRERAIERYRRWAETDPEMRAVIARLSREAPSVLISHDRLRAYLRECEQGRPLRP